MIPDTSKIPSPFVHAGADGAMDTLAVVLQQPEQLSLARLALTAPDGSPILDNVGPEQDLPMLRPGDEVYAGWSPDASLVLPDAEIPTAEDLEEMLDDS